MSFRVVDEVLDHSRSRATDRNVLVAIAECAHHDGVTWLTIGESENDERKTICRRARCSKREALRAIKALREELREIETRKVRRGRSYVTVYRVVLGTIGQRTVEYSRLPFDLDTPFLHGDDLARWRAGLAVTPDSQEPSDTVLVHDDDPAPSTGQVMVPDPSGSRRQPDAGHGASEASFTVTPSRAREKSEPVQEDQQPEAPGEPSGTASPDQEGMLAAGKPPADEREIRSRVRALKGADADSPRRILPLALQLPRSVFLGAIASVEAARASNPCGLLTHRLRVELAERQAAATAELAASMPGRPYAPAPWNAEALKRDAPDRYVRQLAGVLTDQELATALAGYQTDERVAELLELAGSVRAGDEPPAEPETPEQARARWVDDKARDSGFPMDELRSVVEAWADVDDVERQELLEHAEALRQADAQEAAAA